MPSATSDLLARAQAAMRVTYVFLHAMARLLAVEGVIRLEFESIRS